MPYDPTDNNNEIELLIVKKNPLIEIDKLQIYEDQKFCCLMNRALDILYLY